MNSGVEPGPWVKARLAVRPRGTFCVFPTPGVEPQDTGLLGDQISCKIVFIDEVMALEKPQILAATVDVMEEDQSSSDTTPSKEDKCRICGHTSGQ